MLCYGHKNMIGGRLVVHQVLRFHQDHVRLLVTTATSNNHHNNNRTQEKLQDEKKKNETKDEAKINNAPEKEDNKAMVLNETYEKEADKSLSLTVASTVKSFDILFKTIESKHRWSKAIQNGKYLVLSIDSIETNTLFLTLFSWFFRASFHRTCCLQH
jgi:hypothetical protein